MEANELKRKLQEGYVKVRFIKKTDNEEKVMIGTTKQEVLIENNSVPKGNSSVERKPDPENIVRMFCPAEAGGWRSIDVDTLIEVTDSNKEEVEKEIAENKRLYEERQKEIKEFLEFITENKCEVVYNKKGEKIREIFTLIENIVPEDTKPSKSSTSLRLFSLETEKYMTIKWGDVIGYKKY